MKVHEAEMILEYCADIPCRLNIIRRQCAALDDEIDTMRGVNMDGMPRGGEPGDGPATMAVKMDELGIGDRFRVLHQQQEELRADFELIQKEIDSMSGVHNIILTEFYALIYRVPYASETMFAGTWPRTATHGGIANAEMQVDSTGTANAFRVETAGTIPYRTTHAGIAGAEIAVGTENTADKLRTPYTSKDQIAGTWPKVTTKAALAAGEMAVEAGQEATRYKVETAGTVPYRTTTAGIYDTDLSMEGETEEYSMKATMTGTETCASDIPATLDEVPMAVDVEVSATKFKGKRSGEEPFVQ